MSLTNVVVRGLPFQFTTAPGTKLVPFTVSVNAWLPAAIELGVKPVNVGVGLGCELIGNDSVFDVPPPGVGLTTVMFALPALATSAAAICAVSCPLLTNAVGRGLPFQFTTEPG